MFPRLVARPVAAATSRRVAGSSVTGLELFKTQRAFRYDDSEDRNATKSQEEFADPILDRDYKDPRPSRLQMPEAARQSRFQLIAPENRGKVRRRILEEFRDFGLEVHHPENGTTNYRIPDHRELEMMKEIAKNSENISVDLEGDKPLYDLKALGLMRHIVYLDTVQKVVPLGRTMSYRSLVIVGNNNGCAAYAVAKAKSPQHATDLATMRAIDRLTYIDRFDERTLFHDVEGRWNSCRVKISPATEGHGLVVSDLIACVMNCFGIVDATAKIHGQHNPYTVVRAVFNALSKHENAEERALRTGMRLYEVSELARMRLSRMHQHH